MKDYKESEIVKQYATACGKDVNTLTEKAVGNNGYALGQEFHTTGLTVVQNPNVAPYIAVTTMEGTNISLRSLMGVSSLRGYELKGTFESENDERSKKITKSVTAEVINDFDFSNVFQPASRQFLTFAAYCEHEHFWDNKVVTYLGQAVRPYVANSDSPAGSFERYKKNYKRAMAARLWSVN